MVNRLYLGDALGWDTESVSKVALLQSRASFDKNAVSITCCHKAQLIKSQSSTALANLVKVLGYIPGINVIAGIIVMKYADDHRGCHPNHVARWRIRGVAMILTGPLLLLVDLVAHLYHLAIAKKYSKQNISSMNSFNTDHGHTPAFWSNHPVECE